MHWISRITALVVALGALLWISANAPPSEAGGGKIRDVNFPLAIDGDGYESHFMFKNRGKKPAQIQLQAYTWDGSPWPILPGGNYMYTLNIPAKGTRVIETPDTAESPTWGWISGQSKQIKNVVGSTLIYSDNQIGNAKYYLGSPSSNKICLILNWDDVDDTPGIILSNAFQVPVFFTAYLYDQDHDMLGQTTGSVPALNCNSWDLTDLFPSATAGQVYQLELNTQGKKTGLGSLTTLQDDGDLFIVGFNFAKVRF